MIGGRDLVSAAIDSNKDKESTGSDWPAGRIGEAAIAIRSERRELLLDPGPHFFIELTRIATCRIDRRADDHPDRARLLYPAATRPEVAGVVSDGNDLATRPRCEQ